MIIGHKCYQHLEWDLSTNKPPRTLEPCSKRLLSDGHVCGVSRADNKLTIEFDHSKATPPFIVFGDYTTNRWALEQYTRIPNAKIKFGEWWEPVWQFDVDMTRGTVQITIQSEDHKYADCCGARSSAPCKPTCHRKRTAKRIRKKAIAWAAKQFFCSKDTARQWAWSDNAEFRKAVLDNEKYIQSERGLCAHSKPLNECSCAGLNANLRTKIQQSLGNAVTMKIVLPAAKTPPHMRSFANELIPTTRTSRSGRKVYGVKGGVWGRGETKLERRRIRSRAKVAARRWPTLPTNFQNTTIELNVYIESISMTMRPAVGPDYELTIDALITSTNPPCLGAKHVAR